ncbi:MAG TPA: helix-turn-helix domain-containing protein, partial [Polyangiales bacterium]
VKAGRFRQDLYYRINVVSVNVPPLRERDGDVLRLADHFLERFCREAQRPKVRLSAQVAERLLTHDWPGNVRELENCMERLAALSRYDVTVCQDLPDTLFAAAQAGALPGAPLPDDIINLAELERRHIFQVLERVNGNKSRAAQLLGFDRRTLYRKLDAYERGDPGAAALASLDDTGDPGARVSANL